VGPPCHPWDQGFASIAKRYREIGERTLCEGRIAGVILPATPNVDVGLEAVEWTREWILQVGDEELK